MVTVICEKTGIEFEAESKRTKNHPAIMSLVKRANKEEWYRQCQQALEETKGQFETIEEYVEMLEQVREAALNQQMVDYKKMVARKFAEREARRERAITNQKLAEHGYTWRDLGYAQDEEVDNSIRETPDHDWQLFAPDGRAVSVEQALKEIETGVIEVEATPKTTEVVEQEQEAGACASTPELTPEQARAAEYDAREEEQRKNSPHRIIRLLGTQKRAQDLS